MRIEPIMNRLLPGGRKEVSPGRRGESQGPQHGLRSQFLVRRENPEDLRCFSALSYGYQECRISSKGCEREPPVPKKNVRWEGKGGTKP